MPYAGRQGPAGIDAAVTAENIQAALGYTPAKPDGVYELIETITLTDYKAIKYAEGWISEEDYTPIKAERQALRDQINALELT